jgi:hypothetical protein
MSKNIEIFLYTSENGCGICISLGKLPIYKSQFQALYSIICLDELNIYYDLDNKIVLDLMEFIENKNSMSFYVKRDNNSLNKDNFIFYFDKYTIHKDLELHKILYNELVKYKYFFQFIT